MNILIAGGAGTFLNNILIKCRKEGHKVSVLTGSRFADENAYEKTFEMYKFPYDAACLNEIFEGALPDVTIFMGAFDTNFSWKNEESDSVKFASSLANILMGYTMLGKGRFIYLSSHEVFSDGSSEDITEDTLTAPSGFRAISLVQGENMCENYRKNRNLDIITLRLDHLYGIPLKRADIHDLVSEMTLEYIEENSIHYTKNSTVSLLYENDAVEALYKMITVESHNKDIYHISSTTPITEEELAGKVRDFCSPECDLVAINNMKETRFVLSNHLFESEFGNPYFNKIEKIIEKITTRMKKKAYVYLTGENDNLPLGQRIKKSFGWFIKVCVPFIENAIIFVLAMFLYNNSLRSEYFARLDILLLYVLLFAVVYGQQQATVSALLAVAGYVYIQTAERTGFEIFMDANTYVWIAQLFIVGLSVGYLRDSIRKLISENAEEKEYLETQLSDIQTINSSNARVKGVLETQIVNQTDSVGKIYGITSALDQYSPEEVLFYAAEMVGKLIKSKDVAIYQVSNADYARLFSSTSKKARSLGNSIKYTEYGEVYETLMQNKVYINRKMDGRYPLMANAIFEDEKMKMIIMVWGLSWENMTLSQANQLVVVSALIQNAVLRANRYMAALENQRYIGGTKMLEPESFKSLLHAFMKAEAKDLTECTLLRVNYDSMTESEAAIAISKGLRQSDYFGKISEETSTIYTLLSNTNHEDAKYVLNRFNSNGFRAEICEEAT